MLQRWRSRSESSERARQASRSAGRVGITRVRVSSCAWPLNNRFQVNTGGETGDERVSRHWACRIRLTGSVFPHTPHLPPTRCTAKRNNLLQSKLEKSALESEIASDFSSSRCCQPLVVLPRKWRTGSHQRRKWMVKLKRSGAADVVQFHSNQTQQRSVASLHRNWMKFQAHRGITQSFLFFFKFKRRHSEASSSMASLTL